MTPSNNDDDGQLGDRERHAQKRTRRFWIWMGLLPGVAMLPVFCLYGPLPASNDRHEVVPSAGVIAGVLWMGYCAAKVAAARQQWPLPGKLVMVLVTCVALVTLNIFVSMLMLAAAGALRALGLRF